MAIAARSVSRLENAAAELTQHGFPVLAVPMDVRRKSEIEQALTTIVSEWGAVNILVNNAGISGLSLITDPDDGKWFDMVDTNLNGLYLVTKAVLRHMPDLRPAHSERPSTGLLRGWAAVTRLRQRPRRGPCQRPRDGGPG